MNTLEFNAMPMAERVAYVLREKEAPKGANLYRADLRGASLDGACLSDVSLYGADLYRASLRGADLYRANLRGANLEGVGLEGADLEGADLEGADLRDACLEGADLSRANLYRANLSRANLSHANLSRANLYGTNLDGTNLDGACLEGTCLDPANTPNGGVGGWEDVGDGYVYGYRTRRQPYQEGPDYQDGRHYEAPVFSTGDTRCHPGLYVEPKPVADDGIQVRLKRADLHSVRGKHRCKAFDVIGGSREA